MIYADYPWWIFDCILIWTFADNICQGWRQVPVLLRGPVQQCPWMDVIRSSHWLLADHSKWWVQDRRTPEAEFDLSCWPHYAGCKLIYHDLQPTKSLNQSSYYCSERFHPSNYRCFLVHIMRGMTSHPCLRMENTGKRFMDRYSCTLIPVGTEVTQLCSGTMQKFRWQQFRFPDKKSKSDFRQSSHQLPATTSVLEYLTLVSSILS